MPGTGAREGPAGRLSLLGLSGAKQSGPAIAKDSTPGSADWRHHGLQHRAGAKLVVCYRRAENLAGGCSVARAKLFRPRWRWSRAGRVVIPRARNLFRPRPRPPRSWTLQHRARETRPAMRRSITATQTLQHPARARSFLVRQMVLTVIHCLLQHRAGARNSSHCPMKGRLSLAVPCADPIDRQQKGDTEVPPFPVLGR